MVIGRLLNKDIYDNIMSLKPVGDDVLDLLQKFREESNGQFSFNYDIRMNNIKRNMIRWYE